MDTLERVRDLGVIADYRFRHLPFIKERGYEKHDFREILTHVHPHLKGTPIPEMATQLLCSLKPLCIHDKASSYLDSSNALFRGSLIKRYSLGTPQGYLEIPRFYRDYQSGTHPFDSELATQVVDKLSHDPVEIDFRAVFSDKSRVVPTLTQSLLSQGFSINQSDTQDLLFQGKEYSVKITTQPIGTKEYPRFLHNVIFFNKNSAQLLNIDITDLPDEKNYWRELRLSWRAGLFEMESTAEAVIEKNRITLALDKKLKKYPAYKMNRIVLQYYYADVIGNGLRELSSLLFWPQRDIHGLYDLDEIREQLRYGSIRRPHSWIGNWGEFIFTDEDRALLEKRTPSLISDLLLYFTYDPFLFLILGWESQLFEFVPLGKYLQSGKDFNTLGVYMLEEFIGAKNLPQNLSVAEISSLYKKLVLEGENHDIKQTGPFVLLRALNRLLNEKGEQPIQEEMDTIISLINPLLLLS